MQPRYLTKSRFKIACSCPTKLYYTGKKEYPDTKQTNDFLQQLADGGYQVGKLAEYKFPGGKAIETLDYDEALKKTNAELEKKDCIIYEAAFKFENLFIRADVVVKKNKHIQLYEVKAKSYSEPDDGAFLGKRGGLNTGWKEYLFDVAFQKYVVTRAFPGFQVNTFLTLINKDHPCKVDGLHQCFKINKKEIKKINAEGEEEIRIKRIIKVKEGISSIDLDTDILININVDDIIGRIWNGEFNIDFNHPQLDGKKFNEAIKEISKNYTLDKKFSPAILTRCGKCEFKANPEELAQGKKHGLNECLKQAWKVSDKELGQPTLFELWKGQMGGKSGVVKIEQCINSGKYWLKQIQREDIAPQEKNEQDRGLSPTDRRVLQISYAKDLKKQDYVDIEGLKTEFSKFNYPLHFIDFETIGTAIPFNKGRKPYEAIAFQYSHHIVDKKGNITHSSEWINLDEGAFPNFEFVRKLKTSLNDTGTIFRYATHENTILNKIKEQLGYSKEKDKNKLIAFISDITVDNSDKKNKIEGPRNMIDMLELVKKYYYHPMMKGSNSIKQVLPAIMNSSAYLKEKYSKPGYNGKNFSGMQWYVLEGGNALDPYKLLPPVNSEFGELNIEVEEEAEEYGEKKINSGGPAMMAYAEMQFMETTEKRKEELKKALLRYCELDTLAMVMIYEHWKSLLKS